MAHPILRTAEDNMHTMLAQNRTSRGPLLHAAALLVALAAPVFVPAPAAAADGCAEKNCGPGFLCEEVSAACPAIDCPPGAECPVCEPKLVAQCTPARCDSNADCGADQVCYEHVTTTSCGDIAVPPCPPDEQCEPVDLPANCAAEATSIKLCTPRWQLPCTAAADCGPGFTCEEQQACGCSGSTGSGGSTPGAEPAQPTPKESDPNRAAAPAPPVCSCEPTGTFACVLQETACSTDADCPTTWACAIHRGGVCSSDAGGNTTNCTEATKICYPPSHAGIPVADGGTPTSGPEPAPVPPEAGTPGGGNSTPPRDNPVTPGATPLPGSESDPNTSQASGCSIGTSSTGAPSLGWLALGFAALLGARRRAAVRAR